MPASAPLSASASASADMLGPMCSIPGGSAWLGDHFDEGYPADGEGPVHQVVFDDFRLAAHPVTNAEFDAFVDATGYRTLAERDGFSAVFHLDLAADPSDVLGAPAQTPWWLGVRGADWRHPAGPRSDLAGLADHPVVHVSFDDAMAYCAWARRRLPTEAEWEYAARGGHHGRRFAWGDTLDPSAGWPCNIFQGTFPTVNTCDDGYRSTAPVTAFGVNDYGLAQMAGNVWEWCADWFSPTGYLDLARSGATRAPTGPATGTTRVMRGGSFLCHDSYCHRYRVSARSSSAPDATASNLGFRCAGLGDPGE